MVIMLQRFVINSKVTKVRDILRVDQNLNTFSSL